MLETETRETAEAPTSDQAMPRAARSAGPPGPEPWRPVLAQLREFQVFLQHYLAAESDLARLQWLAWARRAALGALAGLCFATILVAALVLVVVGLAAGVAQAWGLAPWLANVVVGLAALVILAIVLIVAAVVGRNAWRRQLKAAYAERRRRQVQDVGYDATTRASLGEPHR